MNRKNLGVLLLIIEGVVGIAITLDTYFSAANTPCQASPCFPPLGFIFPAIITIVVILITLTVSGIGTLIRKNSQDKK